MNATESGKKSQTDGILFEQIIADRKTKETGTKHIALHGKSKPDVISTDKSNYIAFSIKNSPTPSTQVHLTTQSAFCNQFSLTDKQGNILRLFFGAENKEREFLIEEEVYQKFGFMKLTSYERSHNRMCHSMPPNYTDDLLHIFNNKSQNILDTILKGKPGDEYKATHIIWNNKKLRTCIEVPICDIMKQCKRGHWQIPQKRTTVQFNIDGETLIRCQMKGSPREQKCSASYHSLQFHLYYKGIASIYEHQIDIG